MTYERNHISSACYLAAWSDDRGQLYAVEPPSPLARRKKPENVAFRLRFWGRSPELREQVERRASEIESRAAPVLRTLPSRWPLSLDSSEWLHVALLVGLHIRRNPYGQQRFRQVTARSLARRLHEYEDRWPPKTVEAFLAEATSDEALAHSLIGDSAIAASVLGSMHWSLVAFDEPLLATSDQPVSVVPILAPGQTAAVAPLPDGPLMNCHEIRVAIGPRHALVFTWLNEPWGLPPVRGTDEIAAQLNRVVIGQADKQWFHHPARRPTTLTPRQLDPTECRPVADAFLDDYDWSAALRSPRRIEAARVVERVIEDEQRDEAIIVRVERGAA